MKTVETNNIYGYLPSKLVSYVMNLHNKERPLYLLRHGETIFNTLDKIGGDSELTQKGEEFGRLVMEFFKSEEQEALSPEH